MILVTGASGTVGKGVVQSLKAAGARFRVAATSAEKAEKAKQQGLDAVVLNFEQPETIAGALAGVENLFLLSPPNQPGLEAPVAAIAKKGGMRRIVKLSVIRAETEAYIFGRGHRESEKTIEASGVAWTFLRPNGFMQNMLANAATIKGQGAFYAPAGDARSSVIDARDIGAVAARALTEDGHEGKAYELTGPEALSNAEMAEKLSSALGRKITFVNVPDAEYQKTLQSFGMPEAYAEAIVDLYRWYRTGAAALVTAEVERITGRKPRSFDAFAREHAGAFQ